MDFAHDDTRHLDPVALDALRGGGGTAEERAHLDACPACREELARLAGVASSLRHARAPLPEVPARVDEAVMAAWRDRHGRAARWVPFGRRWLVPAIGTAAVLTLTVTVMLPRQHPIPTRPPLEGEESAATVVPESKELASRLSPIPHPSYPVSPSFPLSPRPPSPVSFSSSPSILDAFSLARALRDGAAVSGRDVNGDGRVDRADVDTLARRAVALEG